jgi:hypothetical membrane protein
MRNLKRFLTGRHTRTEMRWHLAILAVVFWGLVLCARLGYPAANRFSVTREFLSALGSFENRYNPRWFWVFCVAMVYCGLFMAPVMLYIRRRFSAVSGWGSWMGACFFLVGCAGIVMVGLFPFAHGRVVGVWQWEDLHMMSVALIVTGFVPGIIWHALLLFKDRLTGRVLASDGRAPYLKFLGPYLACLPVLCAVCYQIHWMAVGAAIRAAVSGQSMTHPINVALGKLASFPLLEHLAIWGLTVFVIWFTAVLPGEVEREGLEAQSS